MTAQRFVKTLIERRVAVENPHLVTFSTAAAKTCRILSKAIYKALGVENIRHRRDSQPTDLFLCGGFCRWILCWNTFRYELAPRRAGEARVF